MNAITEIEVLKYLIRLVNKDNEKPVSGVSSDMHEPALSYLFNKYSFLKWWDSKTVYISEKRVEEKED